MVENGGLRCHNLFPDEKCKAKLGGFEMQQYWTWGGEHFGYRRGDSLVTHDGREVGRFHGDDIYGVDGRYLGEVRNGKRLITNLSKKSRMKSGFRPRIAGAHSRFVSYVGFVMYAGFEDFPAPDEV